MASQKIYIVRTDGDRIEVSGNSVVFALEDGTEVEVNFQLGRIGYPSTLTVSTPPWNVNTSRREGLFGRLVSRAGASNVLDISVESYQ